MFRTTILSAAIAFTALTANPAFAEEATSSRIVYFGDLNLASAKGPATLQRRVDRAISLVCGDGYIGDVKTQQSIRECRQTAHASASPKVAQLVDQSRRMASADVTMMRISR